MIAIIDYGMGNLRSVQKAFEFVDLKAEIVTSPAEMEGAGKIVLPGVGAFSDAMDALTREGWVPAIRRAVEAGKPLLGICLGMQLLFEHSEEGGSFAGLGLLPGRVRRLPEGRKIPHMGWNDITLRPSPLFAGIAPRPYVYFVHSYYADAAEEHIIATADYGLPFCAAVQKGNIYATQFHPEKSGDVGLNMLRNFGGIV